MFSVVLSFASVLLMTFRCGCLVLVPAKRGLHSWRIQTALLDSVRHCDAIGHIMYLALQESESIAVHWTPIVFWTVHDLNICG